MNSEETRKKTRPELDSLAADKVHSTVTFAGEERKGPQEKA
jgi:hypothetical protein